MSDSTDAVLAALRAAQPDRDTPTRLATITALSTGSGNAVQFDGESSPSTKRYRAFGPARVGDRVLMLRVGATWVIAGRVETANDTGWIAPSLQNSWSNYGSPWDTAGYRRIDGIVYLKGLIRLGTASAVFFTLPVGFRPIGDKHYIVWTNSSAGAVNVYASTGNVQQNSVNPQTGFVSLDDVGPFPADG